VLLVPKFERCDNAIVEFLDDLSQQGYSSNSIQMALGHIVGSCGFDNNSSSFALGKHQGEVAREARLTKELEDLR